MQNGTIDLEEFIGGIALCLHGTVKDKCRLLFHIFNLVNAFLLFYLTYEIGHDRGSLGICLPGGGGEGIGMVALKN